MDNCTEMSFCDDESMRCVKLEKEKNISKEVIMDAIEKSLVSACEKDFGKDAVIDVSMDRITGDISVFQKKLVVSEVENDAAEISLTKALAMDEKAKLGDEISIEIRSKEFGRIAAQKARSIIVQAIKEGERDAVFEQFACKEKDIIGIYFCYFHYVRIRCCHRRGSVSGGYGRV